MHDGTIAYSFDVPEVSPTVRGFAAILGLGLKDATPEQVLTTPGDIFFQMGLHKVLTPQRLNGSAALLGHMKRLAIREMGKRDGSSGLTPMICDIAGHRGMRRDRDV